MGVPREVENFLGGFPHGKRLEYTELDLEATSYYHQL